MILRMETKIGKVLALVAAVMLFGSLTMSVPAYAAPFGSLDVSASNTDTGKDAKYTITAKIATKAFVKTLTVTFEPDFVTNGGSAADASLGGVEGMREDGSLACSASACTYTDQRPVRLNPNRIITLILDGVNNPDTSGSYDASVVTKDKNGITIDSGIDSVTISSNIATIGDGPLDIANMEGSINIAASDVANSADVLISAEDDITLDAEDDIILESSGSTMMFNAKSDDLDTTNELVIESGTVDFEQSNLDLTDATFTGLGIEDVDGLQAALDDLQAQIDAEEQARIDGDALLQDAIDLINDAIDAINDAIDAIESAIDTIESAIDDLAGAIDDILDFLSP